MTKEITHGEFKSTLNQKYTATLPQKTLELELVNVSPLKAEGAYESFSLLFKENQESFLLQKIYPLKNDKLGEMEMFIAPITPPEDAKQGEQFYQAVFNREKK